MRIADIRVTVVDPEIAGEPPVFRVHAQSQAGDLYYIDPDNPICQPALIIARELWTWKG